MTAWCVFPRSQGCRRGKGVLVTQSLISQTSESLPPNQAIVLAESLVKAALDALSAHIAILDEDGVIIHVNKAWKRFGEANAYLDPAYGVGTNYLAVCDKAARYAEDAGLVADGIRRVRLRDTEEFHMEYPCHSPTERRWFVVRVTRFSWYGRTRIIVAHQNVTELKVVQNELRDSKRWLEAILDNLVDGVITFTETGSIVSLNRAGAYIFGYERDEMVGQPIHHLLPTLAPHPSQEQLAAFLEQVSGLGDEIEGQRKDGTTFPMYFAVSRIELDERCFYTAIIQDFTERKFLESQLWDKERLNLALEKERELRDLKNRFISMMSHDLKTPLAAIRLANSMLRNYGDRLSAQEKTESYDTIDQQVEYLTELINDVMTISRADFTGAELNLELVDLETYCRDILEELQLAYRMQRVLNFVGTNQRIETSIDRKLMRRAITNLLSNALKYSPADKPVTLELTHSGHEAIIRVIDEGIGIPEDDQDHLFEPFHRASNVGSVSGTGLGLAIAKQAVDLHHGTITVESHVNRGTVFTITLPTQG